MSPPAAERAAANLARAFLAGEWSPPAMAYRAGAVLGDGPRRWVHELAEVVVRGFRDRPVDAPRELAAFIAATDLFRRAWHGDTQRGALPWPGRAPLVPTGMGRRRWPVPPIDTAGDLAEALGLAPSHLDWFSDLHSLERFTDTEPLRHYTYRWVPKRRGGARLLEAPKPLLRFFQRRLLHEILDLVPAHDAAHGFRAGRSVHSYVEPHLGRRVVIRLDLEHFFASVTPGRIFAVFRAAGYPEPVAHRLTGLTTNAVPAAVRRGAPTPPADVFDAHRRMLGHLAHPHLPQGAPTSPALANLAAFALDRRLSGLADAFGARYTRYADDLAFSGDQQLARAAPALVRVAAGIARAEGFRLNDAKTRVRRQGERQVLAGLVVNEKPNVDRRAYDRLKAVLHDAASHGAEQANRHGHPDFRAHLQGRIAWVAAGNAGRGRRLQATFDRIDW